MFTKSNRLSTNFEFNIARKYGKRYEGSFCNLYILDAKNYDGPVKIGIVTSKKLHKVAPKRNRIKRLYREAVKKKLNLLPKGYWIVVHPKSISLEKSYEEISTDIDQVLSKVSFS